MSAAIIRSFPHESGRYHWDVAHMPVGHGPTGAAHAPFWKCRSLLEAERTFRAAVPHPSTECKIVIIRRAVRKLIAQKLKNST